MFFHALLDPPLTSFSLFSVFFQCQRTFDTTTNDTGRYTDFEVSLLSNLVKSNNSISDIGMLILFGVSSWRPNVALLSQEKSWDGRVSQFTSDCTETMGRSRSIASPSDGQMRR